MTMGDVERRKRKRTRRGKRRTKTMTKDRGEEEEEDGEVEGARNQQTQCKTKITKENQTWGPKKKHAPNQKTTTERVSST